MPTKTFTKDERRAQPLPVALPEQAERVQVGRVHRLKIQVAAWIAGTTAVTALWVVAEW